MQPVHGYDVRRELLSWRLEEHTNVKPGSIYNAIRTLEKDGCIAVHSRESEESRPERTSYVLTGEGETEFEMLLRQAWWTVTEPSEPMIPALSLMIFMSREELVRATQARVSQLQASIDALAHTHASIRDGATGEQGEIPEHVREIIEFLTSRTKAEIDWARTFQKRLRAGRYRFAGEGELPALGHASRRPS